MTRPGRSGPPAELLLSLPESSLSSLSSSSAIASAVVSASFPARGQGRRCRRRGEGVEKKCTHRKTGRDHSNGATTGESLPAPPLTVGAVTHPLRVPAQQHQPATCSLQPVASRQQAQWLRRLHPPENWDRSNGDRRRKPSRRTADGGCRWGCVCAPTGWRSAGTGELCILMGCVLLVGGNPKTGLLGGRIAAAVPAERGLDTSCAWPLRGRSVGREPRRPYTIYTSRALSFS